MKMEDRYQSYYQGTGLHERCQPGLSRPCPCFDAQGKREEAMDVLVDALDNGLTLGSAASLSEENDLRSLSDSPRFQLILQKAKGRGPEKPR